MAFIRLYSARLKVREWMESGLAWASPETIRDADEAVAATAAALGQPASVASPASMHPMASMPPQATSAHLGQHPQGQPSASASSPPDGGAAVAQLPILFAVRWLGGPAPDTQYRQALFTFYAENDARIGFGIAWGWSVWVDKRISSKGWRWVAVRWFRP